MNHLSLETDISLAFIVGISYSNSSGKSTAFSDSFNPDVSVEMSSTLFECGVTIPFPSSISIHTNSLDFDLCGLSRILNVS